MNSKFLFYTLKRLGMALLTIFLVIAITFFVMHAIPASPFSSEKAKSDAVIKALEVKYGFDKPLGRQCLNYLWGVLHFDFGLSTAWVGFTVTDLITNAFLYSASIGFSAAIIALLLGVLFGCLSALNRGKWPDKIIQVVTTALVSMPSFVVATLLLLLFSYILGWLPSLGTQPGGMWLPIISLSMYPMAYITRLQRSSMLDVLGADYIRTARAKGVAEPVVVVKHAFRNALIPIVTMMGLQFGFLLGGSIVVEVVFNWPGMGRLLIDAVDMRDYPVIQALVLLFSLEFILINLAVDVLYAVINPTIRFK